MKKQLKTLALAAGACMALASGVAQADSQYGYNAAGVGPVTAQANVKLKVTVPLLILLRVGSATAIDELAWTAGFNVTTTPAAPADGNNQTANWNGLAPAVATTSLPSPATLAAYAWTNSSGGGTLSCGAPTWTAVPAAAVGPTNANITVTQSNAALSHPSTDLGCATTSAFAKNTALTSNWTYALGGTPASWGAGVYTTQVTYTATSL